MLEPEQRLSGLNGVRAIACLMVIAHHAAQRFRPWGGPDEIQSIYDFFITGAAGVSVFFVLSGFLLSAPFWRSWIAGERMPLIRHFIKRRFVRIAPAYWLVLGVTFLIATLSIPFAIPYEIERVVSGFFMVSAFSWQTLFPVEINGPLWSISFEVVSYALLGLGMIVLFLVVGKKRTHVVQADPAIDSAIDYKYGTGLGRGVTGLVMWCAVLAGVLILNGVLQTAWAPDEQQRGWQFGMVGGAKYWWPHYNPIGFFAHSLLGIIASGVCQMVFFRRRHKSGTPALAAAGAANPKPGTAKPGWGFDIAAGVLIVATIVMLWFVRGKPDFFFAIQEQPYYYPLFAALVAGILFTLPLSRHAGNLADNPVFNFVARISFGLYLWHYLVMEALNGTVFAGTYGYGGESDLGTWALKTLLALVISFGLAMASWYGLERPLLRRFK